MFKTGLKLWSTNKNYISEATKLYKQGLYNFIELFVVPNTYHNYVSLWKNLNIPYIIHAPHTHSGLNPAKKELFKNNIKLAQEAFYFADTLNAKFIIFHPGIDGSIKETARQLKSMYDKRMLIENKPYIAVSKINGKHPICNGNNPKDIKYIMREVNIGFCFDIGHAICSANSQNIKPYDYLLKFQELSPKMYHLSDGDINGIYDEHISLGKGSYNLKKIIELFSKESIVTIETDKHFKNSLKDFEQDIKTLQKLYHEKF
jgi:deoxyribonuclease IV